MNKDSTPSPAEQAAREILKQETEYDSLVFTDDEWVASVATIIQQAIDRSVAETEAADKERIKKLEEALRMIATTPGPRGKERPVNDWMRDIARSALGSGGDEKEGKP